MTVSQGYAHPTPKRMERDFEPMERLNALTREQAEAEARANAAAGAEDYNLPVNVATSKIRRSQNQRKSLNLSARALSSAVRAADS